MNLSTCRSHWTDGLKEAIDRVMNEPMIERDGPGQPDMVKALADHVEDMRGQLRGHQIKAANRFTQPADVRPWVR